MVKKVCATVRWEESMQYAVATGGGEFLEVGPGKVLSAMMRRIAPHVKVLALDEILDF